MSEPVGYGYDNNQQSVCPRHPEQVTYVRCGRCSRLACGNCQVPLEVGMMCVDCMQQVRATQPASRTARSKPVVTYALIAINVLVWGLQWIFPSVTTFGLYNPAWVEYSGEWYRALTSGFLHSLGNLSHLSTCSPSTFLVRPWNQFWDVGNSYQPTCSQSWVGQLPCTLLPASGATTGT